MQLKFSLVPTCVEEKNFYEVQSDADSRELETFVLVCFLALSLGSRMERETSSKTGEGLWVLCGFIAAKGETGTRRSPVSMMGPSPQGL